MSRECRPYQPTQADARELDLSAKLAQADAVIRKNLEVLGW